MTLDELQAELDALKAENAKIVAKNAELLKEKKAKDREADEARTAKEEAEEAAARAAGDMEKLEKSLAAKYQKTIDKLTGDLTGANAQLQKLVVDTGINGLLDQHNVAPQFKQAVTALLKMNDIQIADGVATVAGKPLADFAAEFFSGDQGKHFVAAPANTGGGATGSTVSGGTSGWTADNITQRMTEYMAIAKQNPAEAAQIAQQVGRPDLAKGLL